MSDLIFIDFEASSLAADSWPIEIGISWLDEREKLRTEAKLIKPHPSWPMSAWSESSQKIHGITFRELEAAMDATAAAQWALDRLSGATLMSDAAEFDQRWLCLLLDTVQQKDALTVSSIQKEAMQRFSGGAIAMFFKAYANHHTENRAAGDALRLGQAWRAALRRERRTGTGTGTGAGAGD